MEMYCIFSELLYMVANYEKGRIKISGFWNKRRIDSVNESLGFMLKIVQWMETPSTNLQPVLLFAEEFCAKNTNIIFPQNKVSLSEFAINFTHQNVPDLDYRYKKIIELMSDIITECIVILKHRKKGYKMRLCYLLRALHNLPRPFFALSTIKIYDKNRSALEASKAIEYATFEIQKANQVNQGQSE